jgi:2',3'-cyclic-nucleotide 2'-phosphodiesterase (5'-nucleotidase family)
MKSSVLASALLMAMTGLYTSSIAGNSDRITLIHIGDIHGHMIPRPNARSDSQGSYEGGLARMYTQIQKIRKDEKNTLLLNTGDTIQGSAEAMYTRGQALVDVLNTFGIDAFAPGNWEFVYGTQRFIEMFGPNAPKAPWNALSANLYYDGEPYADKTGQHVLPPYIIKQVGNLKVGLLGLTTDRGPQVVGKGVTKGFRFLKNGDELDTEVVAQIKQLRETEKVDLLVVLSEMGLANNIRIADKISGIDVILSSDMHEITSQPVVSKNGTVIVEEGQDGTVMGQLALTVKDGKMQKWDWKLHHIDKHIKENKKIAALVKEVRKSFITGPDFKQHVNPFNGTLLQRPIDTVIGTAKIPLHRSNFSHENMPAVIEGSSHDFLADAFRAQSDADIGAIRGFRYGTHVLPGPIKMEDLYHFIPIGPMIARGTIKGKDLKAQIEGAANGSLNPNVETWTGGWLFNYSGVTMNLDPFAQKGARASGVKIFNKNKNTWEQLDPNADYTYASYYYKRDPDLINVLPAANIEVVKDDKGMPLDGVEVVVRYLQSLPNKTANPELNRIKLLKPLSPASTGSPEIQPWHGVQ